MMECYWCGKEIGGLPITDGEHTFCSEECREFSERSDLHDNWDIWDLMVKQ